MNKIEIFKSDHHRQNRTELKLFGNLMMHTFVRQLEQKSIRFRSKIFKRWRNMHAQNIFATHEMGKKC